MSIVGIRQYIMHLYSDLDYLVCIPRKLVFDKYSKNLKFCKIGKLTFVKLNFLLRFWFSLCFKTCALRVFFLLVVCACVCAPSFAFFFWENGGQFFSFFSSKKQDFFRMVGGSMNSNGAHHAQIILTKEKNERKKKRVHFGISVFHTA